MIEELRIRGLGVIEDAVLPLGPGLTVVTGETGAGKTMVISGLLLLFGGRIDAARVRVGAEQASVDGRLDVDPASSAARRVAEAGGELDDGRGLVLRRTVSAAGRSRAHVGGAAAPVAVLAELADGLLAVHGQSDQVRLTRPGQQRATLDRFAGIDLTDYAAAYDTWRKASAALQDRSARLGELRREAALLSHGVAEIDAASPQRGEDAELTELANRLAHADGLRLAAASAHDALVGGPDEQSGDVADAVTLLGMARRGLQQQSGADPRLDALTGRLVDIAALTADLAAEFGSYAEELDADPARLEQVEGRRAVLNALIRKYGDGDLASVLDWAERARDRLTEIDVSDEALAALTAQSEAAARRTAELAEGLSAQRVAAAAKLANAVTAELGGLAMPSASLSIEVRPRPMAVRSPSLDINGTASGVGPDGADEVEFLLRPQPAAPALPIGRGASGGELSRVMLALEVCLAGTDPVPTMVFDEVDAGVGGRAAVEVGRRLARLARDHQVLVVTHLAQVAAFADRHIVVDRPAAGKGAGRTAGTGAGRIAGREGNGTGVDQVTTSDVRVLDGPDRVAELARMLAGTDSATAREHAAELLADAAGRRPRRAKRKL